jgi:ketosteroid isomerase-like protein
MSQENVEIVRRAWEASVRRDNNAAFVLYDPEIEIDLRNEQRVGASVYHGLEGVQKYFRDMLSAFTEMTSEVEEWIDAGDQVIAMVRSYGRGRRSGVPVDMLEAHLWTVRDGKLRRLQAFATKAEALEAAGLSE